MNNFSEALAKEILKELKVRRRWGFIFKLIFFGIIASFIMIVWVSGTPRFTDKPHTALIEINGVISDNSSANSDDLTSSLKWAFENKAVKGIILRINSPGGTPVTVSEVFNEIMRFRKKYPNTKIYAVCSDICASGAYYLAAAADAIYANPSSLIGSIAVIHKGFGFVETLNKLGIERRMYTAGENKGFLDPFSPAVPAQVDALKEMLNDVHQQFINDVKLGRGQKLKESQDLFSGSIWTGIKAKTLGLIDDFGNANYVAREIIKEETLIDYTVRPNYFERVTKRFD